MKPYEILLVEDSAGDVLLTKEAFRMALGDKVELFAVKDGMVAMDYLDERGPGKDIPFPSLILLDLNLPRKNGIEVLQEIKGDKRSQHLPVIILSTSSNRREIRKCYDLGANSYLVKPLDFDEFVEMVRRLDQFWFNSNILPFNPEEG